MSEKRFIWKCDDETCHIFDTVTKARYFYEGIMNLLNEQQATITHLEKVNGKNFAKRRLLEQDNLVLRNENEQLRQQLANYELAKRNLIKRLDDREKEDFERFFK